MPSSRSALLPGSRLILAAVALAVLVIAMGAYTRLVGAGLGCPDWPGCYGQLLAPATAADISAANAKWPDNPVDHQLIVPEVSHRILAGTLGLLILMLAVIAWQSRKKYPQYPLFTAMLLPVLVVAQALFGMWTVTLKLWPQVVTIHLLGGFAILTLLWLQTLRLRNVSTEPIYRCRPERLLPLKFFAVGALLLTILQIVLGGWLSANYAAVACPDLPLCRGQWWPQADFAAGFNLLQRIGPVYLGGALDDEARVAIHLVHRLMAVVLLICLSLLAAVIYRLGSGFWAVLLLLAVWLQLALGLANIIFHFPVAAAVSHNLGGALLLMAMVTVLRLIFSSVHKTER